MTEEEFHSMEARMKANAGQQVDAMPLTKPSKWKNIKKSIDGHLFDSTGEANRYIELKALLEIGMISDLILQPRFILQEKQKGLRKIEYRADFRYRDEHGYWVNEDFKGAETPVFKIKLKMFKAKFPLERLDIIKKGKR